MGTMMLENQALQVLVLPERGGKLASLRHLPSGAELLAQPTHGSPELLPGMPFEKGDAAGFDDVFPSMGEKERPGHWPEVPDHGMVWTQPMQAAQQGNALELRFDRDGWDYRKSVRLEDHSLILSWDIQNDSDTPRPFTWVCHCLWRLDPNMSFSFPDSGMVDVMDPEEKPCAAILCPPAEGSMAKTYTAGPVREGRCGCIWPDSRLRMTMEWDARELPFLGFWITNGGWRGDRNFAFEPCLSYYDTLARSDASNTLRILQPGGRTSFGIRMTIEET